MRVALATYGSRGDVEPLGGLAAQWRAPGARFAAVAGGCDALMAGGVMLAIPAGAWR
jgi:hypothetical protein